QVLLGSPIRRRPEGRPTPASFLREYRYLWREHGSAEFDRVNEAATLIGALDVVQLEGALHDVIRRHESLRCNLVPEPGRVSQVVRAPEQARLELVVEEAPGA